MAKLSYLAIASLIAATALVGCRDDGDATAPDPAAVGAVASGSLSERLNAGTMAILPKHPGKNWVFDAYVSADSPSVAWSRFWTRKIDFSGVAWDTYQTLTMVSPRHAVMASHYQRALGAPVILHDRRGREVERAIIARESLPEPGIDIAVVLLHEDVPDTVKTYPVLAPSDRYMAELPGTLVLVTDRERKVHVHKVNVVHTRIVFFDRAESLPEGFYEPLITGDSGNPSFVMVRGEPVLIETHTRGGPGSGPFYGNPINVEKVNAIMRRLSEANGAPVYQLRTVTP